MATVTVYTDNCDVRLHKEQRLKARRQHTCSSCGGVIPPKATYYRHDVLDEDGHKWSTYKICGRCAELVDWNLQVGYGCEISFNEPLEDFFGAYDLDDLPGLVDPEKTRNPMPRKLANWLARRHGLTLAELERQARDEDACDVHDAVRAVKGAVEDAYGGTVTHVVTKSRCDECRGQGIVAHPIWEAFYAAHPPKELHGLTVEQVDELVRGFWSEHGYDQPEPEEVKCHVCDGSGRVTRRIPIADFWAALLAEQP